MHRLKRLVYCSIYLMAAFTTNINAADIYQWTDENGKVHFGDKPPRGKQAKNISKTTKNVNVDSSGSEREKLGKIFAPMTPEEKAHQQQQANEKDNRQSAIQQACIDAKAELTFFQQERFYWIDENGNASNATEAERQDKIKELKNLIAENCS